MLGGFLALMDRLVYGHRSDNPTAVCQDPCTAISIHKQHQGMMIPFVAVSIVSALEQQEVLCCLSVHLDPPQTLSTQHEVELNINGGREARSLSNQNIANKFDTLPFVPTARKHSQHCEAQGLHPTSIHTTLSLLHPLETFHANTMSNASNKSIPEP